MNIPKKEVFKMKNLAKIGVVVALLVFVGCAGPTRIYIPNPSAKGAPAKHPLLQVNTYNSEMIRAAGEFFINYKKAMKIDDKNALYMSSVSRTYVKSYRQEWTNDNNNNNRANLLEQKLLRLGREK